MATPVQQKPAIIRVDPLEGRGGWGETLRVLPAWIISAGIHALLFFLFYLVVGDATPLAKGGEAATGETINTKVEAPQQELPLTNGDEGLDPSAPPNDDVSRQTERAVRVPGPG